MFWFGIICFTIAILAFGLKLVIGKDAAPAMIGTAIAAAIVGAFSFTVASYNKVPTRNVGIVTQFGKPTGKTTGAGLHWTKPWQDIDDWDASGQTFDRLGDNCL
jgi:hypothetical protein